MLFETSGACLACHNGLSSPGGDDISIGSDWRGSMMANSARDPYWQASVRRETIDHPKAAAAIEDECAVCHMPMARTWARANDRDGQVFAHLPMARRADLEDRLAHDGVSCTLCHQITDKNLGRPESFTGGYVIDVSPSAGPRRIFGPVAVDKGRTTIMRSSTGFRPIEATHIQQSELCATCHTLYTRALDAAGEVIGRLPEQMPYQEWRHSAFEKERSCQACHMPVVEEDTPFASVLGEPRQGFSRHTFRGGNFFMLRMLNRYRAELGVQALPKELEASLQRTLQQLQLETATVAVESAAMSSGRLEIDVAVRNLAGHKLPTGYPARRAWLHLTVRDRDGRPVFESGRLAPSGQIQGNDNDTDPSRYEPHYREIRRADDVQIYESVMVDGTGAVTTGLLKGLRFIKDNRLLPRGFDKATAEPDIAVTGSAAADADFTGGGDRVRYSIDPTGAEGPFQVDAELWFQPIGFRWAQNLKPYDAPEPQRFVRYYEEMAPASGVMLARATTTATR